MSNIGNHDRTRKGGYSARLLTLAHVHVSRLTVRGPKGKGLCCFRQENTPSLSFDFEKGVFHCFGCGKGGGVKDFALAVGEPWGTIRHSSRERARFAVQARTRQAEEQARAILQQRKDERDNTLWAAWFDANTEANSAAELLVLFFRHPNLGDEFFKLATRTEREYGEAVSRRAVLEAQLGGEVEVMP